MRASRGTSGAGTKKKRQVPQGRACVTSTFNNTIVTITDSRGDALCWASGGTIGFQGTKKGTAFAAQLAAENAARKAIDLFGMSRVAVFVKGPGSGRETAIRALQASGLEVGQITDVSPIPHNGCRPKKRRRV